MLCFVFPVKQGKRMKRSHPCAVLGLYGAHTVSVPPPPMSLVTLSPREHLRLQSSWRKTVCNGGLGGHECRSGTGCVFSKSANIKQHTCPGGWGGLHQLMAVLWSGDGVDAVTEGSPGVRCYVDGNAH